MNSYLYVQANVRKYVSCMIIYRQILDKYYCVILYYVCLLSVCLFICVCSLVYHKW